MGFLETLREANEMRQLKAARERELQTSKMKVDIAEAQAKKDLENERINEARQLGIQEGLGAMQAAALRNMDQGGYNVPQESNITNEEVNTAFQLLGRMPTAEDIAVLRNTAPNTGVLPIEPKRNPIILQNNQTQGLAGQAIEQNTSK